MKWNEIIKVLFGWLKYLPTCNILFFLVLFIWERERGQRNRRRRRKKKKNPKAIPSLHIRPEEKENLSSVSLPTQSSHLKGSFFMHFLSLFISLFYFSHNLDFFFSILGLLCNWISSSSSFLFNFDCGRSNLIRVFYFGGVSDTTCIWGTFSESYHSNLIKFDTLFAFFDLISFLAFWVSMFSLILIHNHYLYLFLLKMGCGVILFQEWRIGSCVFFWD